MSGRRRRQWQPSSAFSSTTGLHSRVLGVGREPGVERGHAPSVADLRRPSPPSAPSQGAKREGRAQHVDAGPKPKVGRTPVATCRAVAMPENSARPTRDGTGGVTPATSPAMVIEYTSMEARAMPGQRDVDVEGRRHRPCNEPAGGRRQDAASDHPGARGRRKRLAGAQHPSTSPGQSTKVASPPRLSPPVCVEILLELTLLGQADPTQRDPQNDENELPAARP